MKISIIDDINGVAGECWNRVAGGAYPFMRHEFLAALERSGCVGADSGWAPQHCLVYDGVELVAVMPMYRKSHSSGEFVFDHQWAGAYRHYGLSYYPKWLTAIPFTPCPGPRLCVRSGSDKAGIHKTLLRFIAAQAGARGISGWHCLFPAEEEKALFQAGRLALRDNVHFKWINKGYRDFQDYLETFNSRKRKKILRERRYVDEQGITLRRIAGKNVGAEELETFFRFYQMTYLKRGRAPYLNLTFFQMLFETMPERLLLIMAAREKSYVGAVFAVVGERDYYGRYWGCYREYHSLHFEACYYQGLEYCIANGLRSFDPGVQGEHKVARGFEPVVVYSAHWIADSRFAAAIHDFVGREGELMARYHDHAATLLPFKNNA